MDKCCLNCKYCIVDFSVGSVECGLPEKLQCNTEWVYQAEADIYTPDDDYCTEWLELY